MDLCEPSSPNDYHLKHFILHPCSWKPDTPHFQPTHYYRVVQAIKEYCACDNWPESPLYLEVAEDVENPTGDILAVMRHQPHPLDDYEGHWVCFWNEKMWFTREVELTHRFNDGTYAFRS